MVAWTITSSPTASRKGARQFAVSLPLPAEVTGGGAAVDAGVLCSTVPATHAGSCIFELTHTLSVEAFLEGGGSLKAALPLRLLSSFSPRGSIVLQADPERGQARVRRRRWKSLSYSDLKERKVPYWLPLAMLITAAVPMTIGVAHDGFGLIQEEMSLFNSSLALPWEEMEARGEAFRLDDAGTAFRIPNFVQLSEISHLRKQLTRGDLAEDITGPGDPHVMIEFAMEVLVVGVERSMPCETRKQAESSTTYSQPSTPNLLLGDSHEP